MNTAKTTPDAAADEPVKLTRANPMVWARFLLLIAALLAVDLGLKYWSFQNVADTPIRVRTAEGGGPEVLIPTEDASGYQVVSTVGPMGEPPRIPAHEPIEVIPGLLNLQLTLNTGAVFGTGQGGRPIFIGVSVIAVIVILFLIARSPAKATAYQAGLALILSGALGNLYDRINYSAVRDMLHMLPSTRLWPWIFNPADVQLIAGVCLVLLVSYLTERKAAKQSKSNQKT